MQEVCKDINENISHGEDVLLNLGYASMCNCIRVLDYAGYHYLAPRMDTHFDKYDMSIMISALRPAYEMLNRIDSGLNKNQHILCYETMQLFLENVFLAMGRKMGMMEYYYPYYGRLDGKSVVLYGAGNVGRSYYKSIMKDQKVELVSWIDKNAEKLKEEQGFPVDGIGALDDIEFDYIVVAVDSKSLYLSISKELADRGIEKNKILWNPTKPLL
jgi:FlaA1/EpsC-like NDP-sugar epimerase